MCGLLIFECVWSAPTVGVDVVHYVAHWVCVGECVVDWVSADAAGWFGAFDGASVVVACCCVAVHLVLGELVCDAVVYACAWFW